jgi:hypothetical protein
MSESRRESEPVDGRADGDQGAGQEPADGDDDVVGLMTLQDDDPDTIKHSKD